MNEYQLGVSKKIASMLDGRQYGSEMIEGIEELAKKNNLVIVFGASDDLMEFRGAINDELDCYEGGTAYLTKLGLIEECECDCVYYQDAKRNATKIKALWCETTSNCCWTYEIELQHERFMIWDDGEQYCRGIVFSLDDIK